MNKIKYWLFFIVAIGIITPLQAQLCLPKVLCDHMVLQQGKPVAIWGTATPESDVEVSFLKQRKHTVADESGSWCLYLDPMKASATPEKLRVRSGKEQLLIRDVLVGEVWLASGQSNMEYSMNNHPKYAKPCRGDRNYQQKAYERANNPSIRLLHVQKRIDTDTLPSHGWQQLSQESLKPISAVAYFFAEMLADSLQVPVGIISSSWGGTPIEAWTPTEAYLNTPPFSDEMVRGRIYQGIDVGKRYRKLIAPLIPYTLRGFLWYQGEQNLIQGDMAVYAEKQRCLIESWRQKWNDKTLSFYYVQLAPYMYSQRRNDAMAKTWETLPEFRQVQALTMEQVTHTGMVVTTDLCDSPRDIHPPYKWEVGRRLARWALANDYGFRNLIYKNPSVERMHAEGDTVWITFRDCGEGLMTADGRHPDWFWVAGKDGRYFEAKAELVASNCVAIRCERVRHPMSVRFGWDEVAAPNLRNSAGLPAIPFKKRINETIE